jgi:hypothetical protein
LIEFVPNEFERLITSTGRVRLQEFEPWDVTTLPLKGNLIPRLRAQMVKKEVPHASLWREKLWIIGAEEILSLPCSLFLRMMALLNLIESNHSSPHDSVLLTQNLHLMLWIGQVDIKGHDIVNEDISGQL